MKVSIIVPMYNVQEYVGECLQSLRTQTFRDFEVLCIDDCATDHSVSVAKEAVQGDSRFRFLRMPKNSGLSAVRNRGIDEACGDYLMFVDSDDMLRGDAVATAWKKAAADDLDDLFFTASSLYESDEVIGIHQEDMMHRASCDEVMTGPELFVWFMTHNEFWPSAPLHMVRREFLIAHGLRFYEGILHEDELYSVQTLAHAARAAYLNEPLYRRRLRAESIMTSKKSMRNIDGVFRVTQEMQRFIMENAASYSDEFVDAYTRRIVFLRDYSSHDVMDIPEPLLDEYAEALSLDDRIDFDMYFRENALNIKKIYSEITDTRTFRVGHALVQGPALIRDLVTGR